MTIHEYVHEYTNMSTNTRICPRIHEYGHEYTNTVTNTRIWGAQKCCGLLFVRDNRVKGKQAYRDSTDI